MQQVLTFTLGEELFGLEIACIQEILEAPRSFFIPNAPDHYLGAINSHGKILPVIDLADLLNLPTSGEFQQVLVLSDEIRALALAVSRVGRILPFDHAAVLPCDQDQRESICLSAIFCHEETMINLLDLSQLLARLAAH